MTLKDNLHQHRFKIFWIIIALLSIALHFATWDHAVLFLSDQARDATTILDAYEQHRPILAGPTTSLGTLHTGPLFYYLYAPFLIAFQFHPIAGIFFGFLILMCSIIVLWYASRLFLSPRASIIAVLLFTTSEVVLIYSLYAWNPNAMMLFFLIWFLAIVRGVQTKHWGWFEVLVIAASLTMLTHLHLSTLALIPVTLLVIPIFRIHAPWKWIAVGFGIFLGSFIPLIYFNARSGWQDIAALENLLALHANYAGTWYGSWASAVAHPMHMVFAGIYTPVLPWIIVAWTLAAILMLGAMMATSQTPIRARSRIGLLLLLIVIAMAGVISQFQPIQWHYGMSIVVIPIWLLCGAIDRLRSSRVPILAQGLELVVIVVIAMNLGSSTAHVSDVRASRAVTGYGSEYPSFQDAASRIAEDARTVGATIDVDVHRIGDAGVIPYLLRTQHPDVVLSDTEYVMHYLVRRWEDGVPDAPYETLYYNDRVMVFKARRDQLEQSRRP